MSKTQSLVDVLYREDHQGVNMDKKKSKTQPEDGPKSKKLYIPSTVHFVHPYRGHIFKAKLLVTEDGDHEQSPDPDDTPQSPSWYPHQESPIISHEPRFWSPFGRSTPPPATVVILKIPQTRTNLRVAQKKTQTTSHRDPQPSCPRRTGRTRRRKMLLTKIRNRMKNDHGNQRGTHPGHRQIENHQENHQEDFEEEDITNTITKTRSSQTKA